MTVDQHFRSQLEGYRLATAEIIYHLPDHPSLLQTYVWQDYDIAPKYPVLRNFLDFWKRELEGAIHSIRLADRKIISAADIGSAIHLRLH